MATAFSDNERILIEEKLQEVAIECLQKYGVKKTTVEQITQMAGISKGSFYSFYPKKEILFFKVLEDYQKYFTNKLNEKLITNNIIGIDEFTELLYDLYKDLQNSVVMNIFQNQEVELLVRKLPKEVIEKHFSMDKLTIGSILSNIKIKDGVNVEIVAASLRSIVMIMLHTKEVGEDQFDDVLKLLLKGIALQIIEGEENKVEKGN